MKTRFFAVFSLLAVGAALLGARPSGDGLPHGELPGESPPAGADCAAGCGAGDHHPKPFLPLSEHRELLARYALEPMSEESEALETLLYHHEPVRRYLAEGHRGSLDAQRLAFLERELARTHVRIELRLVDGDGAVRMRLGPVRVQLEEKQHLSATETDRLQPARFNGTVKRVGLHHLWTRM